MTRSTIAAIGLILCSGHAVSAQQTQRLTASKDGNYGLVYTLPSTAINITVEAERTVASPGEFYKYASRYFDAADAVPAPTESWKIVSVTLASEGVTDPDAPQYLVTLKSSASPFIITDRRGMPLAINTDRIAEQQQPALPQPRDPQPTPLDGPDARRALTAEMVQSSSQAKKAELAAARIMEIRASRNDYLTGQADQMPDGEALKIILKNLDAQEEALTAMFLGTRQTSTQVITYTVTPGQELDRHIIGRLSNTAGPVEADDLRGAPIYLDLQVTARGTMPVNDKGETKKMPRNGVPYCIPGTARATVSFGGRQLAAQDFEMAQFGVTYSLDPELFTSKKSPSYLIFNPATGGIQTIAPLD